LKKLLHKCIQADRKAQNELYGLLHPMMAAISMRYTDDRDEAQGYVSVGFVKIVLNLEKLKDEAIFWAWAKRVFINALLDEYKKYEKYRRLDVVHTGFSVEPVDKADYLVETELEINADELMSIINSLPPTSAKVFNLFAIDDYSHNEIAELLEISVGTSRWHLNNARNLLKEKLEKKKQQKAESTIYS
jgi:RNA polymerase sigma factor (sigma-70 family)